MIPLCGDLRLARALEEALSFAYPLERFLADYEAAREYARRAEEERGPKVRPGAPPSRRPAEDLLASYRQRHGLVGGTVRAIRAQLVLVALAEHWQELSKRGLAKEEAGAGMLSLRDGASASLLREFLDAEVTARGGVMELRLDFRGVREAIQKVGRERR